MSKLRELVSATVDGHQNSAEDVQSAFAEMLSGEASATLMASFLTALRTRGKAWMKLLVPSAPCARQWRGFPRPRVLLMCRYGRRWRPHLQHFDSS